MTTVVKVLKKNRAQCFYQQKLTFFIFTCSVSYLKLGSDSNVFRSELLRKKNKFLDLKLDLK